MVNRRRWLTLAGGAGFSAWRAVQGQSNQSASAARQQSQSSTIVRVEMPQFEGMYLRDIDGDNLQAAEYLAGVKPYLQTPTADQIGWFQIGQKLMLKEDRINFAWRLFGIHHGTRSGLQRGDLLDAAISLDFLPEARILPAASRLPVRLDPLFRFERPLKEKATVSMQVKDAGGNPLGEAVKFDLERLEEREVSLPFEAKEGAEVFAHYTLTGEQGTVAAQARRPVLIASNLRTRTARLAAVGGKYVLESQPTEVFRAIGARTMREVAAHYESAMASYAAPFPERMHPFLANAMEGVIPRCWTSSARGDAELAPLEALASRLAGGEPVRPEDLALPRLVWRPGQSERDQVFRVLLPDGFDSAKRWPLVVALHPELGDEGTLDEMFLGPDGKSVLHGEAKRRGYVVLLPGAPSPFAWQTETRADRLAALVRHFAEAWPIDPKQVFLWGHSGGVTMGFRLLLEAGLWAGAALVAGRPPADFDYSKCPDVPLALLSGGQDVLTPPRQMLVVSYKLQRSVNQRETIALKGQDHWSAGAAGIAPALEFFDKVRSGTGKPAPAQPGR